jgi:signal peptidase II
MKLKYLLLAAISGVIVTTDQAAKIYIHTHFHLGESFSVIANFFNLTYVRNPGAAFGFLASSHPAFREMFFLSMPPIALLIILAILRGIKDSEKFMAIALSLVFGGAVGNYIDRLHYGFVVDFLDFTIVYHNSQAVPQSWSWPAFNIADMGIVSGVCSLLFLELIKQKKSPDKTLYQEDKIESAPRH